MCEKQTKLHICWLVMMLLLCGVVSSFLHESKINHCRKKKEQLLCYTKRVTDSISSQLAVLCEHPDGQSVFFYCIQLSVIRPFI